MDKDALNGLYAVIKDRKQNPSENSYTCYLFKEGLDKILKKCGEECAETIIAAKNPDKDLVKNELADLIYHLLVLMAELDIPYSELRQVLEERSLKIGNLKQMKVVDRNS